MSIYDKGYSNRSNAKRGAKSMGVPNVDIEKRADGKFYFVKPAAPTQAATLPGGAVPSVAIEVPVVAQVARTMGKNAIAKSRTAAKAKPKARPKYAPSVKNPYNIEKHRPKANGIVRESAGTVGDRIWLACDKLLKQNGGDMAKVTRAMVVEACKPHGVNPTTAVLRFYRWRKFHGLRGRPGLKKAQKATTK